MFWIFLIFIVSAHAVALWAVWTAKQLAVRVEEITAQIEELQEPAPRFSQMR